MIAARQLLCREMIGEGEEGNTESLDDRQVKDLNILGFTGKVFKDRVGERERDSSFSIELVLGHR